MRQWRQMDQPTFADLEYQGKKRKTRREPFLNPNPPKGSGHSEEARDERSRIEAARP